MQWLSINNRSVLCFPIMSIILFFHPHFLPTSHPSTKNLCSCVPWACQSLQLVCVQLLYANKSPRKPPLTNVVCFSLFTLSLACFFLKENPFCLILAFSLTLLKFSSTFLLLLAFDIVQLLFCNFCVTIVLILTLGDFNLKI